MTILVTGSTGHLGEAVVRALRAQRRPVRGLDIKQSPFTDVVGSICDAGLVQETMRGITAVVHTAALHKPHIVTHSEQSFIDTNITGTLNLLQAAVRAGVSAFVQTSTTSTFGNALTPPDGAPAAWIHEEVLPLPRNIYGATKLAAEHLCRIFAQRGDLPVVVLRTARFFPEEDDNAAMRQAYSIANTQALELLYRRADLDDVVSAHLAAIDHANELGFAMYVISATTPFSPADLVRLNRDAPGVITERFPMAGQLFGQAGWRFFPRIGRVYDNRRAREELSWQPGRDFDHVLRCLAKGEDFRSAMAMEVGAKGYHSEVFTHGPYPV